MESGVVVVDIGGRQKKLEGGKQEGHLVHDRAA
jgi:hypothetical protein